MTFIVYVIKWIINAQHGSYIQSLYDCKHFLLHDCLQHLFIFSQHLLPLVDHDSEKMSQIYISGLCLSTSKWRQGIVWIADVKVQIPNVWRTRHETTLNSIKSQRSI